MSSDWEEKLHICDIGKRMYDKGFVAANDGNISIRMADGRFLCTPTGVSKGFMKPEDIAIVDADGRQLDGRLPRTSEILLHLEVYRQIPQISAVCHAHPPHATAFAITGTPLPVGVLPEVEIFLGPVPTAHYATPGTQHLADSILPHLRNKANTILLANHGAIAFDKSLEQAYFHLETLDMYCRILLLSNQIGKVQMLPDQKVQDLLEIKKRLGIDDPRLG